MCVREREQARCISRNSSGRRRAERAGAEQSQHDCRPPAPLARSEMGEGDSGDDDDDDNESNDCTVCDIFFFFFCHLPLVTVVMLMVSATIGILLQNRWLVIITTKDVTVDKSS